MKKRELSCTAVGNVILCSHYAKQNGGSSKTLKQNYHTIYLLFGREVMTNLDSILKRRDITLSIKVHLVKTMVFPVFICGCES